MLIPRLPKINTSKISIAPDSVKPNNHIGFDVTTKKYIIKNPFLRKIKTPRSYKPPPPKEEPKKPQSEIIKNIGNRIKNFVNTQKSKNDIRSWDKFMGLVNERELSGGCRHSQNKTRRLKRNESQKTYYFH